MIHNNRRKGAKVLEDDLINFFTKMTWPKTMSSEVRIQKESDRLVIESPMLPLKPICAFAGGVHLLGIGVIFYLEKDLLWFVAPAGFLSFVGVCWLLRVANNETRKFGPFATMGDEIVNYEGVRVKRSEVCGLFDVYFEAKRPWQDKGFYRVVFVQIQDRLIPILWQMDARNHRWTSPKLDLLEKFLNVEAQTIEIPRLIHIQSP